MFYPNLEKMVLTLAEENTLSEVIKQFQFSLDQENRVRRLVKERFNMGRLYPYWIYHVACYVAGAVSLNRSDEVIKEDWAN